MAGDVHASGARLSGSLVLPRECRQLAGALVTARRLLDACEPRVDAVIAAEGWPPTRFARSRLAAALQGGAAACERCEGRAFKVAWCRNGLCWGCERALRREGKCPFAHRCRLAARGRVGSLDEDSFGFCAHANRCFSCDSWSCEQCGLTRGDGDDVARLLARLGPKALLFLDFDRTLSSTRGGADPAPTSDSRKRATADEALVELAHSRAHGTVAVVTRNSHARSIRAFLDARGLTYVALHCVKKDKTTKAQVIIDHIARAGKDSTALFADDDLNELLAKPIQNLVKAGRLTLVLFSQTNAAA